MATVMLHSVNNPI